MVFRVSQVTTALRKRGQQMQGSGAVIPSSAVSGDLVLLASVTAYLGRLNGVLRRGLTR